MGHFSVEIYAPKGSNLNGNQHLSPEQRDAAIFSLRERQKAEAAAARHRILEQGRQRVRASKRAGRTQLNNPPKPK